MNANTSLSSRVATEIISTPDPAIDKGRGAGLFELPSGIYTIEGSEATFQIFAANLSAPTGRESCTIP